MFGVLAPTAIVILLSLQVGSAIVNGLPDCFGGYLSVKGCWLYEDCLLYTSDAADE